jgi:hypothetical protein
MSDTEEKPVSFYLDEMMPRAVAEQLTERGYLVVMAVDVDMRGKDDLGEHLVYATEHQHVIVTRDMPFAGRAMQSTDHAGLICWTGGPQDIGGMIRVLGKFADEHGPEDVNGQVFWLKE